MGKDGLDYGFAKADHGVLICLRGTAVLRKYLPRPSRPISSTSNFAKEVARRINTKGCDLSLVGITRLTQWVVGVSLFS